MARLYRKSQRNGKINFAWHLGKGYFHSIEFNYCDKNKIYRAGAYKRLSKDDGRGEVSNSIDNQMDSSKITGNHTVILKSLQSTMTMVFRYEF